MTINKRKKVCLPRRIRLLHKHLSILPPMKKTKNGNCRHWMMGVFYRRMTVRNSEDHTPSKGLGLTSKVWSRNIH